MTDAQLLEISARAATLWERLRHREPGATQIGAPERVLAPWIKVCGDLPALERRLRWDDLTLDDAAQSLRSDRPLPDEPQEWTADLVRYAALAARVDPEHPSNPAPSADPPGPFRELWGPWVDLGWSDLEAALPGTAAALLTDRAVGDLKQALEREVAFLTEVAAYERFTRERAAPLQDSASSASAPPGAERYRVFVREVLADPIGMLYAELPVLARQTVRVVRQWRDRNRELLERLVRHRPEIERTLLAGRALGDVCGLETGLSDRHHNGRMVAVVRFTSGDAVVYKPRPLAGEAALAGFLAWCCERGLEPAPAWARVLDCGDYGFMERVAREHLDDAAGAADYYRRGGALAALLYALRAEDIHAENVIATRRGPVVIDAEMVLQPQRATVTTGEDGAAAPEALGSCLKTGLLTQLLPDGGEDRSLAGLRAEAERREPRRVWRGIGSDQLVGEAGSATLGPRDNAVWVGSQLQTIEDYAGAARDGFERAYRFLLQQRDALAGERSPLHAWSGKPVRVLLRASQEYGRVLQLAALPRNQRSGLAPSLLAEAMLAAFRPFDERPSLWPAIAAERAALERGDLPWLVLAADRTDLPLPGGQPLDGLFARSGLAAVAARLRALSEDDLARQLALVSQATSPATEPFALPRAAGPFGEHTLAIAVAIGERLLRCSPAEGPALSAGACGRALFLTGLQRASGDPRFERAARDQLAAIVARSERALAAGAISLGGATGVGGVIWSLVWLARLRGQRSLLADAGALARTLTAERLASAASADLEGGLAGALLGLLALEEAAPHDADLVRRSDACAELLLRRQRAVDSTGAAWPNRQGLAQTGLSHGAAGIARALAAWGRARGDTRADVAVVAALGYERSLFDAEGGNWPLLLKDRSGATRRRAMVALCRGAPGGALARTMLLPPLRDDRVDDEIARALATTAEVPASAVDHLCCGNLGRSAALLMAARRGFGARWLEAAVALAAAAAARALERGAFQIAADCYDNRTFSPALLHGHLGIGYQLLRLRGDLELPCPSVLELPSDRSGEPP